MSQQVVSKQRVAEHGEVFTSAREVNAMLDLVRAETQRIDSRFLEPACGNGNFLAEILARKLKIVEARYKRGQLDWERNAVLALSSIYGIDILEDNVLACRARLFHIFDGAYNARFKKKAKDECRRTARFILQQNIVWGDALHLKTVSRSTLEASTPGGEPIVFSEWSFVRGSMLKRRCFAFHELMPDENAEAELSLFAEPKELLVSDSGEKDVFIPTPVREYPLTHFLKVADEQETESEKEDEIGEVENVRRQSAHAGRNTSLRLEL